MKIFLVLLCIITTNISFAVRGNCADGAGGAAQGEEGGGERVAQHDWTQEDDQVLKKVAKSMNNSWKAIKEQYFPLLREAQIRKRHEKLQRKQCMAAFRDLAAAAADLDPKEWAQAEVRAQQEAQRRRDEDADTEDE